VLYGTDKPRPKNLTEARYGSAPSVSCGQRAVGVWPNVRVKPPAEAGSVSLG